jgi:site-specific recombinase XerD
MNYFTKEELRRLFGVAYENNRLHHLCMVTMFFSGLRVSEAIAIRGADVCDGQLSVRRLKKSRPTMHDLKCSSDPLFDQTPLIHISKQNPGRLFPFSRQRVDQFVRRYGAMAGLHPAKCHSHAFKHSICMLLWAETHDLNAVQDHVGHKATSSTLVYMRQDSVAKAREAVARLAV